MGEPDINEFMQALLNLSKTGFAFHDGDVKELLIDHGFLFWGDDELLRNTPVAAALIAGDSVYAAKDHIDG